MTGLHEVVFNIELSLGIDIITAFMLGLLLFLIKVPKTEYSRKIAITKNTIAVCYYVCFVLFLLCLRFSGMENYEVFSSYMMFVVTAVSSAILSFSLINLLDEKYYESDRFFLNIGFVAIWSIVFVKSFWWDDGWLKTTVKIAAFVLFLFQCISHIIAFRRRVTILILCPSPRAVCNTTSKSCSDIYSRYTVMLSHLQVSCV